MRYGKLIKSHNAANDLHEQSNELLQECFHQEMRAMPSAIQQPLTLTMEESHQTADHGIDIAATERKPIPATSTLQDLANG